MAALTVVAGIVKDTLTHDSGFASVRLEGGADAHPLSKYATPRPSMPTRGERVELGLDSSGYIRTITRVDDNAPAAPTSAAPTTTPRSSTTTPDRETIITRLAVVKAAAHFVAARPDMGAGEILKIANAMEGWVTR